MATNAESLHLPPMGEAYKYVMTLPDEMLKVEIESQGQICHTNFFSRRKQPKFSVGEKVYVKTHFKSDASKNFNKKLAPLYSLGIIQSQISDVAFIVSDNDGRNERKVHVQDLRSRMSS